MGWCVNQVAHYQGSCGAMAVEGPGHPFPLVNPTDSPSGEQIRSQRRREPGLGWRGVLLGFITDPAPDRPKEG